MSSHKELKALSNFANWSDRLPFEIALKLDGSGEPIEDILDRHGVTKIQFFAMSKDPQFQRKVTHYREEIRSKGLSFKLKAKAQAEDLLTTSWLLIHDQEVSPAVKADLIKSTVRWAGLDNKDAGPVDASGGVSITINLGDAKEPLKIVDAE